jgi:hypothetical protein
MHARLQIAPLAGATLIAFALAGCAAPPSGPHSQHQHPGAPNNDAGPAAPARGLGMMEKQSMCDMHGKMQGEQPQAGSRRMGPGGTPGQPPETDRPVADMMDKKCP